MFVAFITAATFLIFFLFKYNYTRCLWAYMGFSGLLIFGVLGAAIGYELIQTLMIPLDILTYSLCVYNISIVGVLAVFFWPSPLAMRQGYLIAIAAIVAFYFTRIPEWTTWTLLIAMAVYDLYAVLTPGGPLRVIVELAEERNEEIPALVYEARPTRRPVRVNRGGAGGGGGGVIEAVMSSSMTSSSRGAGEGGGVFLGEARFRGRGGGAGLGVTSEIQEVGDAGDGDGEGDGEDESESAPLVSSGYGASGDPGIGDALLIRRVTLRSTWTRCWAGSCSRSRTPSSSGSGTSSSTRCSWRGRRCTTLSSPRRASSPCSRARGHSVPAGSLRAGAAGAADIDRVRCLGVLRVAVRARAGRHGVRQPSRLPM